MVKNKTDWINFKFSGRVGLLTVNRPPRYLDIWFTNVSDLTFKETREEPQIPSLLLQIWMTRTNWEKWSSHKILTFYRYWFHVQCPPFYFRWPKHSYNIIITFTCCQRVRHMQYLKKTIRLNKLILYLINVAPSSLGNANQI